MILDDTVVEGKDELIRLGDLDVLVNRTLYAGLGSALIDIVDGRFVVFRNNERRAEAAGAAQGLELARRFFRESEPLLEALIPDVLGRAAVGLAGEGSECFGCDDEISRDHDWGPGFCIWLPRRELSDVEAKLEKALAGLPLTFGGFPARMTPERRKGRVGPLAVEDFYARFTGLSRPPQTWREWRALPEYALAACTNGEVFRDDAGVFSAFREALLRFYPEDVRRKKIAARCMIMAQAGQYNLPRSLRRGEASAAMLAAARFVEAALSMTFLLNRRFMPFYKWAPRLAAGLPVLGRETAETARLLAATSFADPEQGEKAVNAVERLCGAVASRLREEGLAEAGGDWLWELGPSVQMGIAEPELRAADVMRD